MFSGFFDFPGHCKLVREFILLRCNWLYQDRDDGSELLMDFHVFSCNIYQLIAVL